MLYNPAAALHIMEATQAGAARAFFDRWFETIGEHAKMPRVHDKKLAIVALCALLEMPPDAVPEPVKAGWPGIVGGALKIFKDLPAAIEGVYWPPGYFARPCLWRLQLVKCLRNKWTTTTTTTSSKRRCVCRGRVGRGFCVSRDARK